jgi:hypothetical protein
VGGKFKASSVSVDVAVGVGVGVSVSVHECRLASTARPLPIHPSATSLMAPPPKNGCKWLHGRVDGCE